MHNSTYQFIIFCRFELTNDNGHCHHGRQPVQGHLSRTIVVDSPSINFGYTPRPSSRPGHTTAWTKLGTALSFRKVRGGAGGQRVFLSSGRGPGRVESSSLSTLIRYESTSFTIVELEFDAQSLTVPHFSDKKICNVTPNPCITRRISLSYFVVLN